MGLEPTRLVGEIFEFFMCAYCSMVLENPVVTPCKHTFCNDCITPWLLHNNICPVDRKPLLQRELKPPNKWFLQCLAEEQIKCSFELEGCKVIVTLEYLQNHLASCKYNPNSEITCYKGCNMKIRRREYAGHNCIAYLVNRMKYQENEIPRPPRLIREISHFKQKVSSAQAQNTELNIENRLLKEQIVGRNDVVKVQEENVPKVGENSTIVTL